MQTKRRRLRRPGRSGQSRSLGSLQVLSGTIGAIVNICKRLNGNHSRMTETIEAIQMYSKMHRLFQKLRSKMAQQARESGDEALATVYGGKISV